MRRIGDFTLTWGETLRWDERRQRLYFVDCLENRVHWLDGAEPPLHTMDVPSLPAGMVLAEDGRLVVCLGDGLHVLDVDAGTDHLLTEYPDGLHGRANDATADGHGNLVTGTLNLSEAPGALWWFSVERGWRELDPQFGNCNGPMVLRQDSGEVLVVSDTVAGTVSAYDYDADAVTATGKRVIHDHADLGGAPDGACADREGGVWSTVLRVGKLVRLTTSGVDQVLDVPAPNPSDVAFGGADLRQLYVTSLSLDLGDGVPVTPESGALLCLDGVEPEGAPLPRFDLGGWSAPGS